MADGNIGGAALGEAASSKLMEKEMNENSCSCCKSLSLKVRFTVFGICYVLGK
jgi:hypothetical protein